MYALSNLESDGMVRLHISATDDGLTVADSPGYRRATARMTKRQAQALAYKLLHAANDGFDDSEVAPSTKRGA